MLLLSILFVSCGSDDYNDDIGIGDNSKAPQFIASRNYTDFETYYTTDEKASYGTSSNKLSLSFEFGDNRIEVGEMIYVNAYYKLYMRFSVNINTLKIGDELQNKIEDKYTDIKFTDYTTFGDSSHDNYINGGKIIVKSIDTTNKKISIEFQNLDIWRDQYYLNGNNKEMTEFIIKNGTLEFQYK